MQCEVLGLVAPRSRQHKPVIPIDSLLRLLVTAGLVSADTLRILVQTSRVVSNFAMKHEYHIRQIWEYQRMLVRHYESVRVRARLLNDYLVTAFDPILIWDSDDELNDIEEARPPAAPLPSPPPRPPFLISFGT